MPLRNIRRGIFRLSINPENLRDGKEDSYERLRPQVRFGAQPGKARLLARR